MGNRAEEPSKRELLETLLSEGMVLIHLDGSAQGVDVPPGLRGENELGLNLSYRFQGPLSVDEDGVHATLSFSGQPYHCALPFDAVYAMVSHDTGEGYFFPAEAPPTALAALAAALEEGEEPLGDLPATRPTPSPRPAFSVIQGGAEATDPPPAEDEARPDEGDEGEASDAPPRLRIVK